MEEKDVISNKLREYRARENMTQEALADRIGVTRQTIISIEKNQYTPSLLLGMKIARVFGAPVEDLFFFLHNHGAK